MSKIENLNRYFEVFEAMNNAVPEGSTHWDVMIAAELFIANSIAINNVEKDDEEQIYKSIVVNIKRFVEKINLAAEQESEKQNSKLSTLNSQL